MLKSGRNKDKQRQSQIRAKAKAEAAKPVKKDKKDTPVKKDKTKRPVRAKVTGAGVAAESGNNSGTAGPRQVYVAPDAEPLCVTCEQKFGDDGKDLLPKQVSLEVKDFRHQE